MQHPGIKRIIFNDTLFAIIIYDQFTANGVHFFTDQHFSQQLAYMHHPPGKKIQAHFHNPVPRNVQLTQEVLFIKKGKLRVDFYSLDKEYIESYILNAGDIILLASGGHGFEVLEELVMYEVKQGPYAGENDKTIFSAAQADSVCINHS